jgi:4-hydroxy-3-methylbut-2-enyl diphosphate reductase
MKVYLSSKIGFCFGVKRALKLVHDELKKAKRVYTLGELIHNPYVVESLKREGVEPIFDLSPIKEGTVVISSHGTDPSLIEEIKRKGLRVVDATCPCVLKVREIARLLSKESYQIVIIGLPIHPEIKGVIATLKKEGKEEGVYVVKNPEETKVVPFAKKIGVIVQTTESLDNFRNIVKDLMEKGEECRVFNTICRAIRDRQEALKDLSKRVEAMIIVGGYNSSNTRQLFKICQNLKIKACFIEGEEELKIEEYKDVKKVGIIGGTSTPRELIEKVRDKLLFRRISGG